MQIIGLIKYIVKKLVWCPRNSGIGIAPDALNKVFDRFYRADMSRSEMPGTGLGLPIAKGIAEAHGGRIEVESEVGKGSTFIIYLPLSL